MTAESELSVAFDYLKFKIKNFFHDCTLNEGRRDDWIDISLNRQFLVVHLFRYRKTVHVGEKRSVILNVSMKRVTLKMSAFLGRT